MSIYIYNEYIKESDKGLLELVDKFNRLAKYKIEK